MDGGGSHLCAGTVASRQSDGIQSEHRGVTMNHTPPDRRPGFMLAVLLCLVNLSQCPHADARR